MMRWLLSLIGTVAMLQAFDASALQHEIQTKFDAATGQVYFEPARLVVRPGDTVTWLQKDTVHEHDVMAHANDIPKGTYPFRSPMLSRAGDKWSMTFTKEGTYKYHCHPHGAAGMRGVIVVSLDAQPNDTRKGFPER